MPVALPDVKRIILVHGYSETSLGSYYDVPEFLAAQTGIDAIVLSAFNSLDDHVSIDDLAAGLEDRIAFLETDPDWDIKEAAVVCHSTGALVVRRWLLDRVRAARAQRPPDGAIPPADIPRRLITMAGANHGSSLAQIGKSVVGYAEKLFTKHEFTVGARVLTDLDYGSDFLLRLSREWMEEWNDAESPLAKQTLLFSAGGDDIGDDRAMQVFWGTKEPGSDNTVRISGANLNYTRLVADPQAPQPALMEFTIQRRVPHRIVPGYSHFGDASGILGDDDASKPAFQTLLTALSTPEAGYDALATAWAAENDVWAGTLDRHHQPNAEKQNASIVFHLTDRGGIPIGDCVIAFWDEAMIAGDPRDITLGESSTPTDQIVEAMLSSSDAITGGGPSPIHNDVQRGSYTFYVNYPRWHAKTHAVYIEAHSESDVVTYQPLTYRPAQDVGSLVCPNQFTYVDVKLRRVPDAAYVLYDWDAAFTRPVREAVIWKNATFPPANQVAPPWPKPKKAGP